MSMPFLQFLLGIIFLSIIFSHLTKTNFEAIFAYTIQSFAIVLILLNSFLETGDLSMLIIITATFVVKVVLTPMFFVRLIKKHKLTFAVNTYLNMPITLLFLTALTTIAYSNNFLPLTNIIPANNVLLSLSLSTIFISLFLIVNRKGALSQAIGVLSLENGIVAFALFAGLEQSVSLQLGIIFNLFIWIVIATVFISMIHKHFGSLDVTSMKHLKD